MSDQITNQQNQLANQPRITIIVCQNRVGAVEDKRGCANRFPGATELRAAFEAAIGAARATDELSVVAEAEPAPETVPTMTGCSMEVLCVHKCLGSSCLGPRVTVREPGKRPVHYGHVQPDDTAEIVAAHRAGTTVKRLEIPQPGSVKSTPTK